MLAAAITLLSGLGVVDDYSDIYMVASRALSQSSAASSATK